MSVNDVVAQQEAMEAPRSIRIPMVGPDGCELFMTRTFGIAPWMERPVFRANCQLCGVKAAASTPEKAMEWYEKHPHGLDESLGCKVHHTLAS